MVNSPLGSSTSQWRWHCSINREQKACSSVSGRMFQSSRARMIWSIASMLEGVHPHRRAISLRNSLFMVLFNGSSHVVRFMLNESERRSMEDVVGLLDREFTVSDNLQEEMLRILLKRFIIQSTRIARQRLNITQEKEYSFTLSIIRKSICLMEMELLPDNSGRKCRM